MAPLEQGQAQHVLQPPQRLCYRGLAEVDGARSGIDRSQTGNSFHRMKVPKVQTPDVHAATLSQILSHFPKFSFRFGSAFAISGQN
ncbi:hypothetical protein LH128_31510 [Sphingomonas sp. LH128]|nr:hypothetical protein LH128_31510 [Sphingomonas sp. LH128]